MDDLDFVAAANLKLAFSEDGCEGSAFLPLPPIITFTKDRWLKSQVFSLGIASWWAA
jgi:hypothetical protein